MNIFVTVTGVIFAIFSSLILAYISVVTGMGPWIAPTLVLLANLLIKLRFRKRPQEVIDQELALVQTVGSVGGLVAIAIGFTLPTLYFLDAELFNSWLASPLYFCSLITASTISAGILGMYLAKLFGERFIYKDKLKFPVSLLIHRMITSQSQGSQVRHMLSGFFSTTFFCFIRDGIFFIKGFLPKTWYILPGLFGKELAIALLNGPTLWAVGFATGSVIAMPLLIGMLSKYLVLYPVNHHSLYLPVSFFDVQKPEDFTVAFCSGLILAEAILGVSRYPKIVWNTLKANFNVEKIKAKVRELMLQNLSSGIVEAPAKPSRFFKRLQDNASSIIEVGLVLASVSAFFTYLEFSLFAQIFILGLTLIAAYQISLMGANIGLIPFGRFATFVMIPTMLLFKLNFVQITFLCVFVNVCNAVASDLLFDYKVGQLCNIKFKRVRKYQWIGLCVTAISMGGIFWFLFTNFQVGSPEMFAQRGKVRALLILSTNFNYKVLFAGSIFGYLLKRLRINPALTLGGILMPNSLSIGLIASGLFSRLFKDPESYLPLCSGIFAGEITWIFSKILLQILGY